ncbi:MAG: hypothetical protein WBF21_17050, partial [Steroidobacteraceae bacterium]
MNDTGKRPDRMGPRTPSPAVMFEKVLRAYTEGDLHYADVQLDLKRLLAGGASPEDLVDVLQRWELIEPLPDDAHDGILRHLNEAIELAAAQSPDPDGATDEELESESAAAARAALELEQSQSREFHRALAERMASDEEIRSRSEELERAAERHQAELRGLRDTLAARDKALAQARQSLVERVTDLTVQLEAARTALESEQGKTQEIQRALEEKIAFNEASLSQREDAQRESERYRTELRMVRDSLAARDKTIAQVRHSLAERDAQLAALQQEHAKIVPTLEARTKSMDAELQTTHGQVEALAAQLKASQIAEAELEAQHERSNSHLVAARNKLDTVQAQSSSYFELLRTREWRMGFDQNRFRELDAATPAPDARSGERHPAESPPAAAAREPAPAREPPPVREPAAAMP